MPDVFTEFIKPLFRGQAQECFENARREWQLRKKRGEDSVYWIGRVYGYSIEDDPEKKLPAPVHHAWVTVGDKIADPSPFRYGKGKWSRLPDMPAEDFWLPGTEYRGDYIVDDERLDEPIYYMPTKEEMKKGGGMATNFKRELKKAYENADKALNFLVEVMNLRPESPLSELLFGDEGYELWQPEDEEVLDKALDILVKIKDELKDRYEYEE